MALELTYGARDLDPSFDTRSTAVGGTFEGWYTDNATVGATASTDSDELDQWSGGIFLGYYLGPMFVRGQVSYFGIEEIEKQAYGGGVGIRFMAGEHLTLTGGYMAHYLGDRVSGEHWIYEATGGIGWLW
jgi:hypothetical protein